MKLSAIFACISVATGLGQANHPLAEVHSATVFTCETISLGRPGEGVSYKGIVRNDDYRFTAAIPPGLVGWGGAPGAPFHGFTVFLNEKSRAGSCIHFLVRVHVDLPEDAPPATRGRMLRVKVGNRNGLLTVTAGIVHGVNVENRSVQVELPRGGYKDDLTITLITPAADKRGAIPIFEKFISQIEFW